MSFTITIEMPDLPRDFNEAAEVSSVEFAACLMALARINAHWYLREWDAGREPACCCTCHGNAIGKPFRHLEDEVSRSAILQSTPILFQRGVGSCGPIAATHTGNKIATAIKEGRDPSAYYVELESRRHPSGRPYFHAVCMDDGKRVDATQGLKP